MLELATPQHDRNNLAHHGLVEVLALSRTRSLPGGPLLSALLFYSLAKIAESMDKTIYGWTGRLSGHALKHLLAAVGCAMLVVMVSRKKTADGALTRK